MVFHYVFFITETSLECSST